MKPKTHHAGFPPSVPGSSRAPAVRSPRHSIPLPESPRPAWLRPPKSASRWGNRLAPRRVAKNSSCVETHEGVGVVGSFNEGGERGRMRLHEGTKAIEDHGCVGGHPSIPLEHDVEHLVYLLWRTLTARDLAQEGELGVGSWMPAAVLARRTRSAPCERGARTKRWLVLPNVSMPRSRPRQACG